MQIIVQKYGGSSVADFVKIKLIAKKISEVTKKDTGVVVVVSAMGKTTNQFIEMAKNISENPPRREMDMLLSTGERITMSLLCMALNELGIDSISLTGSQCGIITDDRHNNARVIEVRPFRVQDELAKNKVVVVGGFQGVSYKRDITTLGRGGSDTTAVALAAALNAERCEIYSDIDGVYSADPSLVENAKHLKEISYQQMQEMSSNGAVVLNSQAVQFAKEKNIAIYARSTFKPGNETVVRNFPSGKSKGVFAVVYENNIIKVLFNSKSEKSFNDLLNNLEQGQIQIKELNYYLFGNNLSASFLISPKDHYNWGKLEHNLREIYKDELIFEKDYSTLSLIGEGLNKDNTVLIESKKILRENKINIFGISTTSYRISILVNKEQLEQSINLCHKNWIENE
ncbi:MAG: aspartate kinase [Ignavibacteriales bacterium CG_4_9_14_3_um_filter_30_11]|nr:MAG: aspartate kinase [Ignavibacteriales bacterium CG_4_9_14_3_um_filter_30_11]